LSSAHPEKVINKLLQLNCLHWYQ